MKKKTFLNKQSTYLSYHVLHFLGLKSDSHTRFLTLQIVFKEITDVLLNCQFNMELFNMQRSDLPAIFGSPTNVRVQFFCNNKKENPYCGRTMIANKCNRPDMFCDRVISDLRQVLQLEIHNRHSPALLKI